MAFVPRHCPHVLCPSNRGAPFAFRRRGSYVRSCDGRRVQRFQCHACRRSFSTQTFRLDFGHKKPWLNSKLFVLLASKVTLRQLARTFSVKRKTIERRLDLFGRHAREFHDWVLERAASREGLEGTFVLDELETFEHNRRFKPLTVPVLVHAWTFFTVGAAVGKMPARKAVGTRQQAIRAHIEGREGRRGGESSRVVGEVLAHLARAGARDSEPIPHERRSASEERQDSYWRIRVRSDRKCTYPGLIRRNLPGARHDTFSSKARRTSRNPLFPVNLTLAMMRDGMSRLVRRNWGASKIRQKLDAHLWLWIGWRNYVRPRVNGATRQTPGELMGLAKRYSPAGFVRWKTFPFRFESACPAA